jgi:Ca2+-binding RTX toxin-like protein
MDLAGGITMVLDPNIVGTDGNDFLQATPGINVIDGGAGNDEIVALDGSNTILFGVGSGMDSIDFAPQRSYQYAGFVEEAQKALAILNTPDSDGNLPSGPVTDAYFGTIASKVLISSLAGVTIADGESVASILRGFKPVTKTGDGGTAPLGTVSADLARQAFQAILDWVNEPAQDVIQFGAGITAADLTVQVLDPSSTFGVPNQFQVSINGQDGLIFQLGRGDVVAVPSTGPSTPPPVPITFSFADGTTMTLAELLSPNHAPVVATSIDGQHATQGQDFNFSIPTGTFNDPDAADTLTLSASLMDASNKPVALPDWLKFDASSGTFSGTPANGDVGNLTVVVTATDPHGASVSTNVTIDVANVNDAPVASMTGVSATATQDSAFTYALPANLFTDVDKGDALTMSASALDSNGNPVALPAWLKFDPATGSFSGTPANGDVGTLSVQVTATDLAGAKVSTSVTIGVANINDAPEAMTPIADQSAVVGTAFSLTVPAGTFHDIDVGDTMTLGAMMANGNPLPSWLVFDAANRTLHGTPGAGAVGTMALKIVATDAAGASASDAFALTISAPPVSLPPPIDPPTQGKTFVGGNGTDTLTGTAGNDVLQGNRGRDVLSGGNGDDKLYFSDDASWSIFATRQNNGSPGHSGTGETISIAGKRQSQDILDGGAGNDTLIGTDRADAILLDDTSSPAQRSGPRIVGIERIEAGAGNDVVDLTSRRYAYGDVTIDGGSGNDVLWSSSGNDVLLGGSGNDRMDGGAGNDYLYGGTGRDVVNGGEGVDILQGGRGRDQLQDTSGNTLLDGGSGDDQLTGGSNNVLFIGGKGNDTIKLGSGSNVVAFDRGDGRDVIGSGSGGSSTLSLGAGIRLQDLAFRRSGDNLVLETGNNESITFDNWYRSRGNQAFTKLQFVTEGMTGPGNSTELDDNVETFDFRKLVGAFDSARAKNPGLSRWALTNGLASFHLDNVHNNSKALGGDLAYAYGTAGSLAGIGLGSAQDVLTSAQFGKESQALHPVSGLKEGLVKLA